MEIEEPPAKATAPERAPGPAPEPPGEWVRTGPAGAAVLSAPDGDTLAAAARGAELRVLGREGNWTRVRIEGWVWGPSIPEDGAPTLVAATPGEVAADPGSFRGKLVQWDLRFISLERAEQVRTDFYPGEPFLLTRTITGGDRFVYVAVPPDRLEEVRALAPLERIRIVGRIRTAAAAHTGSPILDLLELRRPGGP